MTPIGWISGRQKHKKYGSFRWGKLPFAYAIVKKFLYVAELPLWQAEREALHIVLLLSACYLFHLRIQ